MPFLLGGNTLKHRRTRHALVSLTISKRTNSYIFWPRKDKTCNNFIGGAILSVQVWIFGKIEVANN